MDVLDAIMKIFADMFAMNGIPGGTADSLVGAMKGFIQGIMAAFEMLQKLFGMFGNGFAA